MRLRKTLGLLTLEQRRTLCEAAAIAVQRNAPVRFICRADVNVICSSGTAWITTEGDCRDVVLGAGQIHIASRGDWLFINGMPECMLRIEPVRPLA